MLKESILADITREQPIQFSSREGFLFNTHECSVFEEQVNGVFYYTAININTRKSECIERIRTPLPDNDNKLIKLALKVRNSKVGGLGRLEVAEGVSIDKLKKVVQELFNEILPTYGYKIREEQIELAEELLDAIAKRKTLLAEAPTGIGKTLVYIIIGILIRRSALNKTWSSSFFLGMSYVEYLRMGILVSTSSIALQKAIHNDVIPQISNILIDWGIIRKPITSILRKGRSNYICPYNIDQHLPFENDPKTCRELKSLTFNGEIIDLSEVETLTTQLKSKISVPSKCYKNCPYAENCRYLAFREKANNTDYDFTICNNQLLLADMKMRAEETGAVLPPYQALILDEAHKLLPAAREILGSELAVSAIPTVTKALSALNFSPLSKPKTDGWKTTRDTIYRLSIKLYEVHKRLFSQSNADEQCDKSLRNIRDLSDLIHHYLLISHKFKVERDEQAKHSLIWELKRISKVADELSDTKGMIRWFINENDVKTAIGGIPKAINERLYTDMWSRGIPTMLTSGTLSVGGDFTALKQTLGLDSKNIRLMEVTHNSPFNYKENCLLYFSENVPDYRASNYIEKLTDEIETLIKTSNGHAAILFTSYKSMSVVHGRLKRRLPNMKDFVLERSTSTAIEQFKESGNGVLFACGSMWEGIDCPGDILSLLVIVKLPFAQPNEISEYEQTLYPNFEAYFNSVLLPDMLIKTKQGQGRGFRTEDDTCVVAICDRRANSVYRQSLLSALPRCSVTGKIDDVRHFIETKKKPNYFINQHLFPSWEKDSERGISL